MAQRKKGFDPAEVLADKVYEKRKKADRMYLPFFFYILCRKRVLLFLACAFYSHLGEASHNEDKRCGKEYSRERKAYRP